MEHHRLRKYRGPETWARVKAAYVAGESAPSVARRFDVGRSNLRRRAMAEGWTRRRIAQQLDLRPVRGGADDPPPAAHGGVE
jgi:transposase